MTFWGSPFFFEMFRLYKRAGTSHRLLEQTMAGSFYHGSVEQGKSRAKGDDPF